MVTQQDREFKIGDFVLVFEREGGYRVFTAVILYMEELSAGVRILDQSNENFKTHWTIYAKILTKLTPKQVLNRLNLGSEAVNNLWIHKNNHLDFSLPIDGTPLEYVNYLLEEPNQRFKGLLTYTAHDEIVKGSISILTHYKKDKLSIQPMKHYHFAVAQAKVLYKFKLNFPQPIYFFDD